MQISLRIKLLLVGIMLALFSNFFAVGERFQLIFMVLSFVVFGIPHGALDLFIEEGLDQKADLRRVFLRYIIMAGIYVAIWYLSPAFALLIFILITAFHFGEIDWLGIASGGEKKSLYFILGLCWIMFLLSYHVQEALQIFDAITRSSIKKEYFTQWAAFFYPVSLAGMILLFIFFFIRRNEYFSKPGHWILAFLQLALLVILAYFTPLWIFFAFYFGIWHSVLSLDKIRRHFRLFDTWRDWIFLLKKAMPFSVLAWIGISYFILLTVRSNDSSGMLSLVFIGLAVLTVPHLQIFTKLNRQSG